VSLLHHPDVTSRYSYYLRLEPNWNRHDDVLCISQFIQ